MDDEDDEEEEADEYVGQTQVLRITITFGIKHKYTCVVCVASYYLLINIARARGIYWYIKSTTSKRCLYMNYDYTNVHPYIQYIIITYVY